MSKIQTNPDASLVVVALGANLPSAAGDALQTVRAAVDDLRHLFNGIDGISPLYRTPCFPVGRGPDYVNAVLVARSNAGPSKVLENLHTVEEKYGRQRTERWAGRTLDLDLLAYGATVLPDLTTYRYWRDMPIESQAQQTPKELILPHPRIADRGFVLIPLCDVLPQWEHPVTGKTALMMRDALPESAKADIIPL